MKKQTSEEAVDVSEDVIEEEGAVKDTQEEEGGRGEGRSSVIGARLANANKRDAIRRQLSSAFESIQVWLMPPPVEKTKDLRKVLTDDLISEDFNVAVK